jgi:hypothetical protein
MGLIAKEIVENSCWVVENNGKKIGTIFSNMDGVTWVSGLKREKFSTFNILNSKFNLRVIPKQKVDIDEFVSTPNVMGFPADSEVFNSLWDVKHSVPVYTKSQKSSMLFCAGHYLMFRHKKWVTKLCPKLTILVKYDWKGPFKTLGELQSAKSNTNSNFDK